LGHLLEDPRFATNAARVAHVEELDEAIAAAIGSRTLADNLTIIDANHLTAIHVQTVADIERHAHWQARHLTVDVPDGSNTVRMHTVTPRLSTTPGRIRWAGGAMGRDNADVFAEVGLGSGDLDRLRREGVI
jgi:formyl-CoA transferase